MATAAAQIKPAPFGRLSQYSDIFVSVAAVVVVAMMVIPMPSWTLDLLLALNMSLTLTVLLVTMYTKDALEFAVFPSLLLVATLFRLALNISATRLVLLHADAGVVIHSFGMFVVGGNYVVGMVVFLILVVIQFVVITSGAGRIAEVAARFTLDAMPGKQMAIDADLNAGIIDEREARIRRQDITREADFYGAMDGAAKFVRGDAIAAIVIILVNIVGGFIIGVVQRHMDLMQALQTYTLLTVGEGLVTQIPALLMSTATGLIVTRAASESHLGMDLTRQVFSQPRPVAIVGAMLLSMALIPGLPRLPFLAAGLLALGAAYSLWRASQAPPPPPAAKAPAAQPEDMLRLLELDPIELEIGYGLIPLADAKQGGDLLERITTIRKHIAMDLGMVVPALRVRDNIQLRPNAYAVKIRGTQIAAGEVHPRQVLAMNPGSVTQPIQGIETREPAFGLPAVWVPENQKVEAEMAGYTVVDAATVVITHVSEIVRAHAHEILSRQDVQALLDNVKAASPALVEDLVPKALALGEVQKVLQNLLRERVSIRDLTTIFETLADHAALTKDLDVLTEQVRQALARQITRQHVGADGRLHVFALDPRVEETLASAVQETPSGTQLIVPPEMAQRLVESVKAQSERAAGMGHEPIALCSPKARLLFRRLMERVIPTLVVLSHAEIASGVEVDSIGMVTTDEDAAIRS